MLLSCQQCRQFDRIAIEEFGIPGIVLMENAGFGCVRELEQRGRLGSGVILCGGGNNGGDGFVIARHLLNRGAALGVVLLSDPGKLTGDAKVNFDVLRKMDTSILQADSSWDVARFGCEFKRASETPLIVDAMLGTGATGALREPYATAVEAANQASAFRIAIDIPTGLDGDSGESALAFKADLTFTFIAWKAGFANPLAKQWLGDVSVVDIGAPKSIYQRFDEEGE
jgi:NAD(P)H-hydrate epimerase